MLTAVARVDTLGYFDRLTTAGVPEAQARIQAELFREQADFQTRELQQTLEKYDETRRKDLATKGDIQDVRLEIEKVRSETAKVRSETEKVRSETEKVRAELKTDIEKVRAELKTDIERVRYDLLKWQIGLAAGIMTIMATGFGTMGMIMAKGFGWIGF